MESVAPVCLHNKATIEKLLRREVYLQLYGIGDLDDFFWPYTTWYAESGLAESSPIALVYTGMSLPTLLIFSARTQEASQLLASIAHLLPQHFHAHLSAGLEAALLKTHHLDSHGTYLKMGLLNKVAAENCDCASTCRLGPSDAGEITAFYAHSYPGNWFDPRMLETGQYFGVRQNGTLASIAGVHVYSRQYGVAALGNIATTHAERNKGYARQATARVCQSLLVDASHVGLNVKADNAAAIACYQKLGFETVGSYGEYMVDIQ
jgi:hypothetical protein